MVLLCGYLCSLGCHGGDVTNSLCHAQSIGGRYSVCWDHDSGQKMGREVIPSWALTDLRYCSKIQERGVEGEKIVCERARGRECEKEVQFAFKKSPAIRSK